MKTRQNTARPRLPERYQLERMLGQGGMAQVWLARDLEADAMVAIKVLFEHLREDALVIERFRREIIASRKLINAHAGVVTGDQLLVACLAFKHEST